MHSHFMCEHTHGHLAESIVKDTHTQRRIQHDSHGVNASTHKTECHKHVLGLKTQGHQRRVKVPGSKSQGHRRVMGTFESAPTGTR